LKRVQTGSSIAVATFVFIVCRRRMIYYQRRGVIISNKLFYQIIVTNSPQN